MQHKRISISTVETRPCTDDDSELVYELKKAALGPYVEKTWGWDEGFQREYHERDFDPLKLQILRSETQDIGVLSATDCKDHIELNEIYIGPKFQGRGTGSAIIQEILELAKARSIPVKLQFLKVNPVRALYERHGFQIISEKDTRFLMEQSFS